MGYKNGLYNYRKRNLLISNGYFKGFMQIFLNIYLNIFDKKIFPVYNRGIENKLWEEK